MRTNMHQDTTFRLALERDALQLLAFGGAGAVRLSSGASRLLVSLALWFDEWVPFTLLASIASRRGLSAFETGAAVGELMNLGVLMTRRVASLGHAV
jgi:hypothetical protein